MWIPHPITEAAGGQWAPFYWLPTKWSVVKSLRDSKGNCASCISESEKGKREISFSPQKFREILENFEKAPPTFFSVSRSQRRFLQIWWLFSFLQGAQSPQLSFLWQPEHSPHRFRFFFVGFSWVSASSPLLNKSRWTSTMSPWSQSQSPSPSFPLRPTCWGVRCASSSLESPNHCQRGLLEA